MTFPTQASRTREVAGGVPVMTSRRSARVYVTGPDDGFNSTTTPSRPVPTRSGQVAQRTRPVTSDVAGARSPRGDVLDLAEARRVGARGRHPQTTNRSPLRDQHRIAASRQPSRRTLRSGSWRRRVRMGLVVVIISICAGCIINTLVVQHQYDSFATTHQLPSARLSAVVGHGDSQAQPTTLFVVNMHGVVQLTEIPAGDNSKSRTYTSQNYVVSDGVDDLPVSLHVADVNHDNRPDVIVSINGKPVFTFVNTGQAFTPSFPLSSSR